MATPIILPAPGVPLWRQVIAYLATDTDLVSGLVAALGNGVQSIYPNALNDGPNVDRTICPTPFLIVYSDGVRAKDDRHRELRLLIEVHDDAGQADQRWPGILLRVKWLLTIAEWRPQRDEAYTYVGGLMFDSESAPNLSDLRYDTAMVQALFTCRALDRTSGHGSNG